MTFEQYRQFAITAVLGKLGLTYIPGSEWTIQQREQYNRELADALLASPVPPDSVTIHNAEIVKSMQDFPLADTSFSSQLGLFGDALVDEAVDAGNAVGGIGRGVLTTAKISAYVIPLFALFAVGIAGLALYKKYGK